MSYKPSYVKGDWIAMCDVCGRKYKASQLEQRWDGLMCCPDDWEIRQPQDFVRGVADTQIAPWLRSEPQDYFLPVTISSDALPITAIQSQSTATLELVVFTPSQQVLTVTSSTVATLTYAQISLSEQAINGAAINDKSLG